MILIFFPDIKINDIEPHEGGNGGGVKIKAFGRSLFIIFVL